MSDNVIQTSFNAGEWAPDLNARVDLAKYHSGAATLRNFFVDYRGGATTRPGTKYILQTKSTSTVRLIRFQASFTVSYVLEFGQGYVRFYNNGAPVLEATKAITAINIGTSTLTSAAHGYANGDWVFLTGIVGTVGNQLNGNYYIIAGATANTFTLTDLNGVAIVLTGAYTSGGTAQRIYTIVSPYQAADLAQIKFAQNVNILVLCHPNYPPQVLTLITATNWTLAAIGFGATIGSPTGISVSGNLAAGTYNYAYTVTAVDANGQESDPGTPGVLANQTDMRVAAGSNSINFGLVAGAVSYNVYKALQTSGAAVPAGAQYGFAGNCTGAAAGAKFYDSNILPDFSQCPPVPQNPFAGTGVATVNVTAGGGYLSAPTVTFTGGAPSSVATAISLISPSSAGLQAGGLNYVVNEVCTFLGCGGAYAVVTSVNVFGTITGFILGSAGSGISGTAPINPVSSAASSAGSGATFNLTWAVSSVQITSPGAGYSGTPAVGFTGGGGSGAAATATLGAATAGNPTVPGYIQQRLFLGGPVTNPQQFNLSVPGAQFNFDTTNPTQADNAIQETLVSGQLNTIQSATPMPQGLIVFSDQLAWLINGGSPGAPISALSIVANAQAYNGSSYLPPIIATDNILYVQAKGSIVRDLVFNFYTQVYTGADISILSSHLFYGHRLLEWAWSEEPYKLVWAVREDGILLTLTFLKEQELIAWAHSDTTGLYQSVASVTEATSTAGNVDAVYTVVRRVINGNTIQYVERFVELSFPNNYRSAWQVDAGIGYNGAPATTFSGAQHLASAAVTGVADGVVINFTMPASGTFVFGGGGTPGLTAIPNASIVTVGLGFTPQLQTLALDLGQPTVQGKRKKVSAVTVRTKNALGLSTGRSFSSLVPMKDLVLGNVGTMSNAIVTGLVTSDARTIVDPQYDVFGQFCIQQSNPYPATILGVVPEIEVGDTQK